MNTPKELRTAAEHLAEHPEWLALRWTRPATGSTDRERRSRAVALRAAPGREAVGLRADLGAQRASTAARCCSSQRASRSRSSTTGEKDESWLVHVRPRAARARHGRRRGAGRSGRRRRATPSATVPAPCTGSPRSRTRRSSRSRRPQLDDVVRLEDAYGRAGTSDAVGVAARRATAPAARRRRRGPPI